MLEAIELEKKSGFCSLEIYQNFSERVNKHILKSIALINEIKNNKLKIVAFGASGRANAFLNYINIDNSKIEFIIDESPERINRLIPKVNIPIKSFSDMNDEKFDCLFITAWNFKNQILEKCKNLNFNYILTLFPEISFEKR